MQIFGPHPDLPSQNTWGGALQTMCVCVFGTHPHPCERLVESWFPDQGSNPHPLQQKHPLCSPIVLTSEPSGKSTLKKKEFNDSFHVSESHSVMSDSL